MQENQWKRNTAIFLTSQAISLFGSSLVQYAITWHITLSMQSGTYTMISILCMLLPTFFVSPFAGVWADRYERKKLVVLSDGFIAVSTLILAVIFLSGYKPIWLLFVVTAIRAAGGAIQQPAVSAMIPDMVPEDQLTRVNGINTSVQSLLTLVSPPLAAALLTMMGSIELVFFIDVVTAALAIFVLLRFLKLPRRRAAPTGKNSLAEIREGFAYIRRNAFLVRLIGCFVMVWVCMSPIAFLTPLQVVRNYGEGYWRLTGIEVVFSAGMLLGGLLMSTWGGLKNRATMISITLVGMGLGSIFLGIPIPFWLYMAVMGIGGLLMTCMNNPAIVLIQENVDDAYMGRVFSVITMLNTSLMPLGMLVFGPLADIIPIEWLLVGCGVVVTLSGVLVAFDRKIRAVGLPKGAQA